jgi:hypothetical protein
VISGLLAWVGHIHDRSFAFTTLRLQTENGGVGHSPRPTWQNACLDNGGGRCPEKSHIGSWDP